MSISISKAQLLELKSSILKECRILLDKKHNILLSSLKDVTESSNNENKSSAGDKHETSKAMMQIEQEKLGNQILEIRKQQNELENISPDIIPQKITKGSLIETNQGLFFVAIGLGKITVANKNILVISPNSPIGKELINGKSFTFNNLLYSINYFV